MFVTADRLLNLQRGRSVHAVSYSWEGFSPDFTVYSRDAGLESLDLGTIGFAVSEEQSCVGSFRSDGYTPCPFHKHVEYTDQCDFCSKSIIPIQRCLFDPICDGHLCDWDLCKRKHQVYIAFYGTKMKVGMTSSERLNVRLIEQGADAFFTVATAANRMAARELEKKVGRELSIPQMHRSTELLDELWKGPDFGAVSEKYTSISSTIEETYGMHPSPLTKLDDYPMEQPLSEKPSFIELASIHEGRVVGIKGRFLVYENQGLKALSLSALTSRRLTLI